MRAELPGGAKLDEEIALGALRRVEAAYEHEVRATLEPRRGFDVGAGKGQAREVVLRGGLVGIVFDCRGRPLRLPEREDARVAKLAEWSRVTGERGG